MQPPFHLRVFGPLLLIAAVPLAACSPAQEGPDTEAKEGSTTKAQAPVTLLVSAASDLKFAFEELGAQFEKDTGTKVTFNFGSTGELATQIKQGAPVDVFASADAKIVEDMVTGGHIIADTQAPYARGSIILWTLDSSPLKFEKIEDLLQEGVEHISIANPAHAPYGRAAQQALETAGLWDELQPKIVTAESVSAAFQMATTGNVEVGIVALSLGIVSKGGRYTVVPQELHKPINQALGVVSETGHEAEARAFAKYVNGPVGRPLMERYGFILPDLAGTSR